MLVLCPRCIQTQKEDERNSDNGWKLVRRIYRTTSALKFSGHFSVLVGVLQDDAKADRRFYRVLLEITLYVDLPELLNLHISIYVETLC
jgi:hypothetical protein